MAKAVLGVMGGSGVYDLPGLEDIREERIESPWGEPSDALRIGRIGDTPVVFLARHGRGHRFSPSGINYRANIDVLKRAGVTDLVALSACGSFRAELHPGLFVLVDQFVDRTSGRAHTFYDGPGATHISTADPYCPQLRAAVLSAGQAIGADVRDGGTMVVVEGPRFSTRAESRWYRQMGWQVINMTGYPEVALARELELCYSTIALITDYDTGIDLEAGEAVSADDVLANFAANLDVLRQLLVRTIEALPPRAADDPCRHALAGARL